VAWPHPSFIHNQIPDGMGIAPFMLLSNVGPRKVNKNLISKKSYALKFPNSDNITCTEYLLDSSYQSEIILGLPSSKVFT